MTKGVNFTVGKVISHPSKKKKHRHGLWNVDRSKSLFLILQVTDKITVHPSYIYEDEDSAQKYVSSHPKTGRFDPEVAIQEITPDLINFDENVHEQVLNRAERYTTNKEARETFLLEEEPLMLYYDTETIPSVTGGNSVRINVSGLCNGYRDMHDRVKRRYSKWLIDHAVDIDVEPSGICDLEKRQIPTHLSIWDYNRGSITVINGKDEDLFAVNYANISDQIICCD